MRENLQSEVYLNPQDPDDSLGHKGERIFENFLEEGFPGVIINIERSKTFDPNDKNGVDFVCEITGGHKFAVDMTFESEGRRNLKMQKMMQNPFATLRDQEGVPFGEPIPRILLYERSTASWLDYEDRASKTGGALIENIPDAIKQKERFLETVVQQAKNIPLAVKLKNKALADNYERAMAPIVEIFNQALKDLKK